MRVEGKYYRTIWPDPAGDAVHIIDQTSLPHRFATLRLDSVASVVHAIKTMQVRGAPLIGAAAAYGMALAMREAGSDSHLVQAATELLVSRPTAVNLSWAVQRMLALLQPLPPAQRFAAAWQEAAEICDQDVAINQAIGQHGLGLIRELAELRSDMQPINILTHCNAGWLAAVDWGTALAPIYAAHDAGIDVHVWVDETRPRNQGASLTAWELLQHGIPHTVICDNAGGHLMQHGEVDMVLVGADRVASSGDVCNKIGTYLKALAAHDNNIPFYAAVPSPSIDWDIQDGLRQIVIEQRSSDEVKFIQGLQADGKLAQVQLLPHDSPAANPAFDVTPARLVTGIISEHGICAPAKLLSKFE